MSRLVVLALTALAATRAFSAEAPRGVEAAVGRGTEYLKTSLKSESRGGAAVLAALAIVKAGGPTDGPEVSAVLAAVRDRCSETNYRPEQNHYYTAGLELMLLDAVDPERHRGDMEKILAYVLKGQKPSGAWFYPSSDGYGDTSITQYATLGLWAAARAGLTVPRETWDKLAVWHLGNQLANGAFTYHPRESVNEPNTALTLGGASSLLLARAHLFRKGPAPSDAPRPPAEREIKSGKRFGVLETVDLDGGAGPDPAARDLAHRTESTASAIQQSVDRAVAWSAVAFRLPPPSQHQLYYLYGLERMAALGDLPRLGDHDWYGEGATWLVTTQQSDGSWSHDSNGPVPGTAFAVLFLTRSTAKSLGRAVGPAELGGGLLVGGRGLPDDLSRVDVKGGDVGSRKAAGPLDELLARLEDARPTDVPGTQQAVLEAVRFGDREKLIGERDRLLRLAADPRSEVRRTAFWALGRGGRLSDVPTLIKGLSDADLAVAVEAHNALCVFSRRPSAFGLPTDPLASSPEGASEEDRRNAADEWRRRATAAWRDWYARVAPYDERDGLGPFR